MKDRLVQSTPAPHGITSGNATPAGNGTTLRIAAWSFNPTVGLDPAVECCVREPRNINGGSSDFAQPTTVDERLRSGLIPETLRQNKQKLRSPDNYAIVARPKGGCAAGDNTSIARARVDFITPSRKLDSPSPHSGSRRWAASSFRARWATTRASHPQSRCRGPWARH